MVPESLFKYCGSSGAKILSDLKIKVTPPIEFNDPFEMAPVVRTKDPRSKATEKVRESITNRSFFESDPFFRARFKSYSAFQRVARANMGALIANLEREMPAVDREQQRKLLQRMSQVLGVICFSKDPTHHLMWAHYADAHKGLLIEFDGTNQAFQTADFLAVEYHPNRSEFEPLQQNSKEEIEIFVRRKSIHWSYEEEMRLLVSLNNTKRTKTDWGDLYLLPIAPELIKSVTYGLRTSQHLRKEVQSCLKKQNLRHVRQWQIEADDFKYELHRREIS